jgi:hypothetical protein
VNGASITRPEVLEAVLTEMDALILAYADSLDVHDHRDGGRPRHYSPYVLLICDLIIAAEFDGRVTKGLREIGHPQIWDVIREHVHTHHEDRISELWLRDNPPRPHHWKDFEKPYLRSNDVVAAFSAQFSADAVRRVDELGLCQPTTGGRDGWTHPDKTRCIYGDGKVVRPITNYPPKDPVADPETGEVLRYRRADPDCGMHTEGGSSARVRGHKLVFGAVRGDEQLQEVILGVELVRDGNEMAGFQRIEDRVLPYLPGAQAILYDGARRGVHADYAMRQYGVLTVAPVSPAKVDKGDRTNRVEHECRIEVRTARYADGRTRQVEVWGVGGVPSTPVLNEAGDRVWERLCEGQTKRRQNKDGTYHFAAHFVTEDGGDLGWISLDTTDEDRRQKINRAEHFRAIHPKSLDFARLYGRRSSAESLNERYEGSLYRRRATVYGANRVYLHALMWAIAQNAIATYLHRQRDASPPTQRAAA